MQSNIGAKNHGIVMPDADIDATLNALVAAGFGAAGQRCIALSILVLVGDATKWENALVKRAKQLKLNAGIEPDADLGPAKERVPGYEQANFVGPTILSGVTEDIECYKGEGYQMLMVIKYDGFISDLNNDLQPLHVITDDKTPWE
ncbi:hypothetical protein L1887_14425 [Cichorium endivia]|nr:hypothetical protein L1887_14425 [Cichorium endivia]